jgi:phage tail sheath gpL-like
MRRGFWTALALVALTGAAGAQEAASVDPARPLSTGEIRELLEAAKATAKAARENVDYNRVVPDLLFQMLTKLDKLEDKLDKVENAVKRDQAARARAR